MREGALPASGRWTGLAGAGFKRSDPGVSVVESRAEPPSGVHGNL